MSRRPNSLDDPLKSYDSINIWSDITDEWVVAFERRFQYLQTITLFDKHVFNATDEAKNSQIFDVRPYARGLMLLDIDVTLAPTDIYFRLQFSVDGTIWHDYIIGPWGDLRYEDAAGDKKECLEFPIIASSVALNTCFSNKMYSKGIKRVGNEKWVDMATKKGPNRFREGVGMALDYYRDGVEPYLNALSKLDLPGPYPAGDPRNVTERVGLIAKTLHDLKVGTT